MRGLKAGLGDLVHIIVHIVIASVTQFHCTECKKYKMADEYRTHKIWVVMAKRGSSGLSPVLLRHPVGLSKAEA